MDEKISESLSGEDGKLDACITTEFSKGVNFNS